MGTAARAVINHRNMTFTPIGGGTPIQITRVQSTSLDAGGSILKLAGDADRFDSVVISDFSSPTLTITANDYNAIFGLGGVGARGTISWTWKDARNQTAASATGDITVTATTAVIQNISNSNSFRQYGVGTVMFCFESVDGATPPVGLTIAA